MSQRPHGTPGDDRQPPMARRAVRPAQVGDREAVDYADGPYAIERVTALTHDLRNLLDASIRCLGMARRSAALLPAGTVQSRAVAQHLDTVATALDRMADLVNAAMRGSASVVGSPLLGPASPITLGDALRHAADVLTPEAAERGVSISLDLEDQAAAAPVGPMYSVVLNGLRNALESVPRGEPGGVTVRVRTLEDEASRADGIRFAEIEVIDDGLGLFDAEHGRRAFDHGFTTKPGGSGVGLALAREIVRQTGGSIELVARCPAASRRRPGAVLRVLYPVLERQEGR